MLPGLLALTLLSLLLPLSFLRPEIDGVLLHLLPGSHISALWRSYDPRHRRGGDAGSPIMRLACFLLPERCEDITGDPARGRDREEV